MKRLSTPGSKRRPGWRGLGLVALGAAAAEAAATWVRSGSLGGNIVVRCSEGHLFTTLWIPGGSVKSLRLGPWRFQRCPIGNHWSLVSPVKESELAARARRAARQHHDLPIP